ncbi:Phenylcoumaran benzylic ether reductase PT1 [Cladobotryum mycophilum]|uniref:Phenylcoumaran benzylic ether reductase PT1 n=1 Tax=Cladobotryum mycophilum TaxID=491253 RepID=A0ABR0SBM0_9HYPO
MSSFKPSHILLFGATGNIGRYITQSIVQARPSFPKITVFTSANTVSKKPELINSWKSSGVSIITGDLTNSANVEEAYRGVDTVISAVGRDALGAQKELIRLAEKSDSVQWFFPSEYGTDTEHNEQSAHEKPHQLKRAIHKFVREEVQRLKVTYVVTGPYFDMWVDIQKWSEGLGGFDIKKKDATILGDGEQKISFTTMNDVGTAVVSALRHPEASFNQTLRVASFVVTPNQVLAEFEKQLGAKFNVKYIPLPEVEATEKKLWEEGNPFAVVATLRRIWTTGGALYPKLDNADIGLEEKDLESLGVAVKQHIDGAK